MASNLPPSILPGRGRAWALLAAAWRFGVQVFDFLGDEIEPVFGLAVLLVLRRLDAALDVFEGEPIINASLLECGKTVLLPHLGSATLETRQAMGFRVIENLDDFFEGREPRDRVI